MCLRAMLEEVFVCKFSGMFNNNLQYITIYLYVTFIFNYIYFIYIIYSINYLEMLD